MGSLQGANFNKLSYKLHLLIALTLYVSLTYVQQATQAQQLSANSRVLSLSTSPNFVRLRQNKLRRPDACKESLPRKAEELPALVVVGKIRQVLDSQPMQQTLYSSSSSTSTLSITSTIISSSSSSSPQTYTSTSSTSFGQPSSSSSNVVAPVHDPNQPLKALVNVFRVVKGNPTLEGSDIVVAGFNSTSATPCPNYIKPNDTVILLLNPGGEFGSPSDRAYSIQNGNLLAMNLQNLDKINAIAANEPYKRRGPIDDILCEAHYCPFGRCKVSEQGTVGCHCPDFCPTTPGTTIILVGPPVCGSDNATYANECELIKESCKRQRPLFVKKESHC